MDYKIIDRTPIKQNITKYKRMYKKGTPKKNKIMKTGLLTWHLTEIKSV